MAEREDKSLDDFFAKRDKKKKKDRTKAAKAGPVAPTAAALAPAVAVTAPEASVTAAPSASASIPAPASASISAAAAASASATASISASASPPAPITAVTVSAEATPVTGTGQAAIAKKPKKEKERMAKGESLDPQQERTREDEEWKEFEQKEVDYSGLRIHALQISDEREEEDNEKKEDQGEDGENIPYREGDKTVGPWNKITPAQAPVAVVVEVPEPKPSGVYRPPAARLANVRRTQSQGPPEIFNDAQFPSLQASAKHVETRKYC
ncbi:protein CDV3 homolog isoform X2 [Heptranchias perlo]|uniref:protein CDV3 homolog isoform X2 n=1 Tax=Heptranchias perlo TaxID=212740 RepID=UPI00355A0A53